VVDKVVHLLGTEKALAAMQEYSHKKIVELLQLANWLPSSCCLGLSEVGWLTTVSKHSEALIITSIERFKDYEDPIGLDRPDFRLLGHRVGNMATNLRVGLILNSTAFYIPSLQYIE